MGVPDLFSRERRWRWAERTTFLMLFVMVLLFGLGLGWWSVLIVAIVDVLSVSADVVRHQRTGQAMKPT